MGFINQLITGGHHPEGISWDFQAVFAFRRILGMRHGHRNDHPRRSCPAPTSDARASAVPGQAIGNP
jgi:hypothetical protein